MGQLYFETCVAIRKAALVKVLAPHKRARTGAHQTLIPITKFPTVRANTNSKSQPTRPITIDLEPHHPSSSEHHKHFNSRVAIMAAPQATVSKRRKFVADGVFYAELNEFFQRELAEEGYSGVEVRVTPTVTDISTSKIFVENISARC
jgi:hypothetical protein